MLMTSKRNDTIVRLYRSGTRTVDLARQFKISRHRVHQIIDEAKRREADRAELEGKYGSRPKITALPDETPIEVLCLCAAHMHGLLVRIGHLQFPQYIEPIQTLGDLRRMTDAELLKEPNVGKKMLGELRRFYPRRNPGYGGNATTNGSRSG